MGNPISVNDYLKRLGANYQQFPLGLNFELCILEMALQRDGNYRSRIVVHNLFTNVYRQHLRAS